jgi:hypothetical protein
MPVLILIDVECYTEPHSPSTSPMVLSTQVLFSACRVRAQRLMKKPSTRLRLLRYPGAPHRPPPHILGFWVRSIPLSYRDPYVLLNFLTPGTVGSRLVR